MDAEWACRFVAFTLRCLACARRWDPLVALARRLAQNETVLGASFGGGGSASTLLRETHALAGYAQSQVVKRATARCSVAQAALDSVAGDLEAATKARLGKRRVRQGRSRNGGEKTDGERLLEGRKSRWTALVGRARAATQVAEHYAQVLLNSDREFRKSRPLAAEALDACRHGLSGRVLAHYAPTLEAREALARNAPTAKALTASYKRAARLIRERREPVLLAQASQDEGDLFLADGDLEGAIVAWQEGVDALFSTLDAHKRWRTLLSPNDAGVDRRAAESVVDYSATLDASTTASPPPGSGTGDVSNLTYPGDAPEIGFVSATHEDEPAVAAALCTSVGLVGCLVGGTLLGKLARFACRGNLDTRLERARFAAPLFRAAFAATLPHPATHVMRPGGQRVIPGRNAAYASYKPHLLTARLTPLFGAARRLSPAALARSAETVVDALIAADRAPTALPLCCLIEHVASVQRVDVRATAAARVLRLRVLTECGLVAEAASVLASLLRGADLPKVAGAYAGLTALPSFGCVYAAENDATKPTPLAVTLPFYGLEGWDASVPPSHERNVAAATWLIGDSLEPPPLLAPANAFRLRADTEGLAGAITADVLRRGCAGLASTHLAAAYGGTVLEGLALARAELLLRIGQVGGNGAAAALLNAADRCAAELQCIVLDRAWRRMADPIVDRVSFLREEHARAPPSPRGGKAPGAIDADAESATYAVGFKLGWADVRVVSSAVSSPNKGLLPTADFDLEKSTLPRGLIAHFFSQSLLVL